MGIDVTGYTRAVLDVGRASDLGRIANRWSYPATVEIETRAGFYKPSGELPPGLKRSRRRRITAQRRGWDRPSRLGMR